VGIRCVMLLFKCFRNEVERLPSGVARVVLGGAAGQTGGGRTRRSRRESGCRGGFWRTRVPGGARMVLVWGVAVGCRVR